MPRGVYDRSKLKTTKKTETASAAPVAKKVKGKPGRKPGAQAKSAAKMSAPATVTKGSGGNALDLLGTVRENLNTLNAVAAQFSDVPTIKTEIIAHVEILSDLRKQVFGEDKDEEVETVSATANGTSTQAAPPVPPSVPMPTMPIPNIAH